MRTRGGGGDLYKGRIDRARTLGGHTGPNKMAVLHSSSTLHARYTLRSARSEGLTQQCRHRNVDAQEVRLQAGEGLQLHGVFAASQWPARSWHAQSLQKPCLIAVLLLQSCFVTQHSMCG